MRKDDYHLRRKPFPRPTKCYEKKGKIIDLVETRTLEKQKSTGLLTKLLTLKNPISAFARSLRELNTYKKIQTPPQKI